MTKEEKLYLAGFFDRKLYLSVKGIQALKANPKGRKRGSKLSITSESKSTILRVQELFGGNITTHYKSSYSISFRKAQTVRIFEEIGPYLKLQRHKLKRFQDFCLLANPDYPGYIAGPEVEFIEHENDINYIAGLTDAGATFGIYKTNKKNRKGDFRGVGWSQKLSFMDDENILSNFFLSKGVKCSIHNKGTATSKHDYCDFADRSIKAPLEILCEITKIHKEKYKILLDSLDCDEEDSSLYRQKLMEAKKFTLDESILTTNPNREKLKEEKQKKLKERARQKLEKHLDATRQERETLIARKAREQLKEVNASKKEYLRAKKIYEKQKAILEDIESPNKFCVGLKETLNKDEFSLSNSSYDGLCAYSRRYVNEKQKERQCVKEHYQIRRTNPLQKLSDTIHTGMYLSLKGEQHYSGGYKSIWRYLGYTATHLKSHLEKQFVDGMTWANYGWRWHVDHIRPKASFDFENEEEFLECWGLENLQPLFAEDNLMKSDKYELKEENKA